MRSIELRLAAAADVDEAHWWTKDSGLAWVMSSLRPWLCASTPFVRSPNGFPLFTATSAVHLFNDFRTWYYFVCTPNWFLPSATAHETLAAGRNSSDRWFNSRGP